MGYLSALDMNAQMDLTTALRWHLASNHFPSLPESILPVARRIIWHARRGSWDTSVTECVRAWHLDAFLEPRDRRVPKEG